MAARIGSLLTGEAAADRPSWRWFAGRPLDGAGHVQSSPGTGRRITPAIGGQANCPLQLSASSTFSSVMRRLLRQNNVNSCSLSRSRSTAAHCTLVRLYNAGVHNIRPGHANCSLFSILLKSVNFGTKVAFVDSCIVSTTSLRYIAVIKRAQTYLQVQTLDSLLQT